MEGGSEGAEKIPISGGRSPNSNFVDLFPKEYKTKEGVNGANIGPSNSGSGKFSLKSIDISKVAELGQSLSRFGLVLCGILFVISLALWGGLTYYKKSLVNQIADLKDRQSKVFSANDKALAAKIIDLQKSSDSAKGLLSSHIFISGVFDKIAAVTLPRAQWQSINLSAADRTVKLTGIAANYSVLAKQMLALGEGGFSNVAITGIKLDKLGGVSFGASFNFDPKILYKQ